MAYFFSLMRFVPDAARGEFINIGAIAGDGESGDWDLRVISNARRARAIDSRGYLPAAMAFVTELSERLPVDEADEGTFGLTDLQVMAMSMNNLVQFTRPEPIVAVDAVDALDIVWRDLVIDEASAQSVRYKNTRSAVSATHRAYVHAALPEGAISRGVALATGAFQGDFDFAVHNGSAVQLVKCFSFQLPNQEALSESVMSWGYLVHELRSQGGRVLSKAGDSMQLSPEFNVASVYIPPKEAGRRTFDRAQAVFDEQEVVAREWTQADDIANIAAELLAGAH